MLPVVGALSASQDAFAPMRSRRAENIVIGVGSDCRGDDAAGLLVARQVKALAPEHVTVYEDAAGALALPLDGQRLGTVILVDAVCSTASPGTVFRFDAGSQPIPELLFPRYSTHGLGVGATIELIRALCHLPPRLIVYGIEGASFAPGQDITPAVAAACDAVVQRIMGDLQQCSR